MIIIDEVKKFLKVDYDDDDSYISLLIEVAKEYIIDAVGSYNDISARHKLILLNIVSALYANRELTVEKGDNKNEKVSYTIRSIITQLQLDEVI